MDLLAPLWILFGDVLEIRVRDAESFFRLLAPGSHQDGDIGRSQGLEPFEKLHHQIGVGPEYAIRVAQRFAFDLSIRFSGRLRHRDRLDAGSRCVSLHHPRPRAIERLELLVRQQIFEDQRIDRVCRDVGDSRKDLLLSDKLQ